MTKTDPTIIVEDYDGHTAHVKVAYEHIVNAIAMYLQTYPFGIKNSEEIEDIDLGLSVDENGMIGMDVSFKR